MSTEQVIAILGVATGLVGGFAGPYFAAKRLERTLAAERRKELIDRRRKLLDQAAVLLVDLDDALAGLRSASADEGARNREWQDFAGRFAPFRARLDLWFDEGSHVVGAFERVVKEITDSGTHIAGRDGADRDLLKAMADTLESAPPDEAGSSELRDQMRGIERRRHERRIEAADRITEARTAFLRAAREYLAGDVPTRPAPAQPVRHDRK